MNKLFNFVYTITILLMVSIVLLLVLLISDKYQIFNLDLVMASTIILCILATLMYFIVAFIEKVVNKKLNN